jgi:NADPH-dependent 2,4-dienoyl-CoA reductase/sulfur reductase-like enzyme
MNKRSILVVGGLAAGPSAAAKAKRVNPRALVTLFESGESVSYGICETPYAIGGVIADESKLVIYSPERLREEKGIEVKTLHRVEEINPAAHEITVRDLRRRERFEVGYDKLILATGSTPRTLGLPGEHARNVFHLSSRPDTLAILSCLGTESPRNAVIIGGGFIGMEMAEAFRTRGLEVTIIHRHRLPMGGLEQEVRERILEELQKNNVRFVTNASVEGFSVDATNRVSHVLTNRGTFEADIVLLAIGVEPNTELARTAKIRVGPAGGIVTDERQQTSADDIYAAGDCCEVKNIVTGKPTYLPLATVASRAAWVAGENAAGGRAHYKGAIRAAALKVFGLEVAQVGLGSAEASSAGFVVATTSITSPSRVGLMPGGGKIMVKLVIDKTHNRLLGANLCGPEGTALRANTLGVAIQHRLSIDEIAQLDLIYAPPIAPLWDPILVAANKARKH